MQETSEVQSTVIR